MSRPNDPEHVLAEPLPDQDLGLDRPKTGVSKVTLGLGVGVLVLAAFGGGVWTHSAFGSTTTSASAPAAGRNGAGGGFRGGANGQTPPSGVPGNRAGGFGRGTVGTVDHVDGTTIYVKTQDGTVVKVSTSDTTEVDVTKKGALADLVAGSQVVVQGTAGDDGTVAAQTVTQRQTTG
ncbi:hypothetical protein ACFFQW_03645 [Umezawaea endophytica]|uniref:DUF5666 domain-containing protein n=1 Tax=Umezawaea endophytica TaxID=1654476 RepID=A0A9X2VNH2_9PSEU|nr:hypothetical protein [Umezawaea endophytica]MCS7479242.1 hypothetical protein [Umezawaea endophytica]